MGKLVSIAMPAYNVGQYIGQCLECLLQQTYTNIEIVLIDDGSTDNTEAVVSAFCDPRIRYYKNEKNLGIVHTLNKAYSLCRGAYIARMDSDDLCTHDRIEKQVAYLDTHPDVGLIACDLEMFGSKSGIIHYSDDPEIIHCRLLYSLQLAHNAWLFRRELLDEHQMNYRDEYRYAEDWDFLVRASRVIRFSNVLEPLTSYRIFPQQSSSCHKKAQIDAADRVARDQLLYLGVELTEDEFRLYRKAFGHREILLSVRQMQLLADILKRLEERNKVACIYNQQALRSVIQEEFFWLCYFNLTHRNRSGLSLYREGWYKGLRLGKTMRCKLWLRSLLVLMCGKNAIHGSVHSKKT